MGEIAPTLPRSRLRRTLLIALGVVSLIALLAARPWSSRNSFRQMRLFAPSGRVQNFREMDVIFPARALHRSPSPHRFEERRRPTPDSFAFDGKTTRVAE